MKKELTQSEIFTLRARRTDRFVHGVIWSFAGLTLAILVVIVGFIFFNGIYTRSKKSYHVLPVSQTTFSLTSSGEKYALVAHKSLNLDNLTYDNLRDFYLGLDQYWGYLTGQNRNVEPLILSDADFQADLGAFLLAGELPFAKTARYIGSPEELNPMLDINKNLLMLVPVSWLEKLDNHKTLGLRQFGLAIHNDIDDLKDGRRLDKLEADQLALLFSGEAQSWDSIAVLGKSYEDEVREDKSPRPVSLWWKTGPGASEREILFPTLVPQLETESLSQFLVTLDNTPGAWGVLPRRIIMERELDSLEIYHIIRRLNLKPSFVLTPPSRAGAVGGISYIIINTLAMILFVLLISTPVGIGAAIYLTMYARQGRWLRVLRLGTDTLAGIPSIIFGLFGLVFFSQFLGLKTGLVSGSLTLTIMILPTIIRTSEEAIKSVPRELMEGSMALGATKHQTIIKVVVPKALPGIITGIILGVGRAVGETAALLFTMGSNLALIRTLNSPVRVLSVHLYMLIRENISIPNAFATATILVLIVFLVNFATRRLINNVSSNHESLISQP